MICTLKRCQTEDHPCTPSGCVQSRARVPVVFASLRPPATFCVTLALESIAIPCSVNANGRKRTLRFAAVTICDRIGKAGLVTEVVSEQIN